MSKVIIVCHADPVAVAKLRSAVGSRGYRVERCLSALQEGAQARRSVPVAAAIVDLDAGASVRQVEKIRRTFGPLVVVGTARRLRGAPLIDAALGGCDAVLPWPIAPEALDRVLRRGAGAAAAGASCVGLGVAQVLTLFARAGEDGVAVVTSGEGASMKHACVHYERGAILHVSAGKRVGVDAVREMLSWPDPRIRWLAGRTGAPRTILGHHGGLLAAAGGPLPHGPGEDAAEAAGGGTDPEETDFELRHPHAIAKIAKIGRLPQVVGACLLKDGRVVQCSVAPGTEESALRRAVEATCHVLSSMSAAVGAEDEDLKPTEIQAAAAGVRIIVDRVGPEGHGYQAGVAVYQAAAISKSLRRLIRQLDRALRRSLPAEENAVRLAGDHRAAS